MDPVRMDFSKELSLLTEINKVGFGITQRPEIGLEREQILRDMLSKFNGRFFEMEDAALEVFIRELSDPDGYSEALETGEIDLFLYDVYNEQQLELAQPFIDELLDMEDMMVAKAHAEAFLQAVTTSSLSEEDKIELLVIGTGVVGISEFMSTGGLEEISLILAADRTGTTDGHAYRCRVNSRNVWLSAVVGLSIGGYVGGSVGCAGGMVAGPIGMAGGCVGGAVMGGASGFITGALSGVAVELLGSCFRSWK